MNAIGAILTWVRGLGLLAARAFSWIKATTWGKYLVFILITYAGGIVGKLFTLIGVTMVINKFVTPNLTPYIANNLLSMPPEWISLLALTKIDQAVTIIISAVGIAMASRISLTPTDPNAWRRGVS